MTLKTADFNYNLPEERIAQFSVEPRDSSRLLVLNKETGEREHKIFRDIVEELGSNDILVMNKTKVFKARLQGRIDDKELEVFLLRHDEGIWQAMIRPGKHVNKGDFIEIGPLKAEIIEKSDVFHLKFDVSAEKVLAYSDEFGEVPIPPYVEKNAKAVDNYQTVYAKEVGSVAAPTAGFHFTEELLEKLKKKGVKIEFITLHVGIGTFRPVKTENLVDHEMHAEFVHIDEQIAKNINEGKQEGKRIIAIGTTTVRALEGVAATGGLRAYGGDVNLFIAPGFDFKVIDGLITNFHLPKSTLIVLVSALAGRENVLNAYKEAVEMKYRFYSFGDAMFIR